MQFSFKRPSTCKSVSAFYRDKQKTGSLPKTLEPVFSSQFEDQNDQNKWKKAAQKINKEMVLHKALHANAQPFRLLSKIGGQVFKSQPKLARTQTPPSKTRIRVTSKQKKLHENTKQTIPVRQSSQETARILHGGIGESKMKRKRRGENFRIGFQQQLKTTNIFYESPVVKIGYNMQFEAYLRFGHITQIRPDHGGSICRNSIIFFLKDAPFSPNIISEKNTQVPIALSLFPQFFDSKLSVSNIKRHKYFQRMLDAMNSTYDPQRMASLPRFSEYPSFDNAKYKQIMQSLMTSNQQNYKSEWAQNILKKLRVKLNERQLKEALSQQWQFFNRANAIITLDYVLKNIEMANKLQVAPYLPTRVITARRILYHGGYCKSLYTSWSSYVENSRKRLAGRLKNYTNITQAIYGWYCNFQGLQLFQTDFCNLLDESVSVDLFYKIQQAKIQFSSYVLQQIWFRGIMCLFHYGKYLMREEEEYDHLGDYRTLLARYIREARSRSLQMKSGEQIEVFYLNFYQNFLSSLRKESKIHDLEQLMAAMKGESPQLSNLKVLLQIQFGKTIQKSFTSLRKQIVQYQRPLLRLHLIIDRQNFKFLQQQQDILSSFGELIKKIFGVKISGYALTCKFQTSEQQQLMEKANSKDFHNQLRQNTEKIRQYPEIYETGERNSLEQDRELNIGYRTQFIFDHQVKEIISCMRTYYKECFSVLGEYEMYLPFIKLTTAQMIFSEEEGPVEQIFLKNLRVISRYKESIRQLQKLVRINIFEVDCAGPIRALQERVREIEYIMEQNYINIIHEMIEPVDSELNSLKTSAHNVGLTAIDIEQTEEKLLRIKQTLKQLQGKMKKIAQMVLFCLQNKRKAETVVTCYCQLVTKKQDLHREVENLLILLQSKRPEVEAETERQVENLLKSIDRCLQNASQVETTCFEFGNITEYITTLATLLSSFSELNTYIQKHMDHCKLRSRLPIEQKIQLFRREYRRFELMIEYWRQFYNFQTYFKDISKVQARTIDFSGFNIQSTTSEQVINRMQKTEQEWWQRDKAGWKPIVHRMHEYYSKKFESDVNICIQLKPLLQILTNSKVRERHWQQYGLQIYKNIIFRELIKLDAGQEQWKLQKMDEEVNFQYEIFLAYEEIQKKIKGHKLLIVDLNDSDVLDLPNLNICVQFLRNVEIDIKQLMQRDVGDYYDKQLQQLLILSQGTVGKLQLWQQVQQRYIRFMRFHMINDQYEHSLFGALIELHKKLIKSYDIDNSVAFISKNIVMDSYIAQIAEELKELDTRVTRFLEALRAEYPRLFLLSDEELFDFMSSGADLQKYLRKCFPQILNFTIREGSIERVGQRRELIFAEPFYIQEMVGRVNSWVSTLEDQIRCRMKEFFKTNQVITEGKSTIDIQLNFYEKYPPQLAILDEQIAFTQQLGEAVATEALRPLLQQIQAKIQYLTKQKRETFKLLLFIVFRQQINALLRVEQLHSQSFQWLKYPRFYQKGQLDIRVSFIHQENIYGFNYLEKSQIIHTDSVFMGNCLVGPSGCGKTAFAKYLAYLCGQQLLLSDPRCINHSQESISALLNYFRVNAFAGSWLLLQRVDLLGESQLRLIAECLSTLQQALRQQSNKLTLSGVATPLSRNCRVLMSVSTLSGTELPGRLCAIVRPVWMSTPDRRFLLELYLQSKRVNNMQVGKILKFCSWLENHREISLEVLNWIRDQQDAEVFSTAIFFQKAAHFGIFQGEGQALLEALRSEQLKMNEQSDTTKFISLHKQLIANKQIVLFGQRSCGKTTEALKNLPQGKFIIINAHHYKTNEQLFEVVRAIRNLQHYSHVVFKHGLQFYPLMRDNLTHFRLLFLQDSLAQLQVGVVFDLRMVDYGHLTEDGVMDGVVQLMVGKVLNGSMSEHLKMMAKGSLFSKCLERAGEAASERAIPNQLYINFGKIMYIMLSQQYEFNVSFLFSLIWAFSFAVQEKKLQQIIKQVFNGEQSAQKNKFQKINPSDINALILKSQNIKIRTLQQGMVILVRQTFGNRLIALTDLVPLKKGKFVSSLEIGGVVGCFQDIQLVADQVVNIRSNFIANLALIRKHLTSPIAIQGKDWLTTILSVSSPQNTRHYNFSSRSPTDVFMELFRGSKRISNFYKFGREVHVTVDDVHLANLSTLNSLTDLSEYGFALFLQGSSVHIYETAKCQFTFAGKSSYPRFSKALRIVIQEASIATIFGEYVQCYCEKYLQVDRSIFSLLNLSNNLNRIYRQDSRYFWYKNPLLLLQTSGVTTLTDFMCLYLDYFTEMLPNEKTELNSQRALLQLPRNSIEQDNVVINTTRKFIRFYSRTELIQKLISDNEVLEQIQASQVQSIFFDKFIKNYFTKDILDYVVKVGKHLKAHHLILLSDNYPHTEKILRYACKISGKSLLSLRTKSKIPEKAVLSMDLEHCKEKELQELQSIIKLKSSTRFEGNDMRFILTGNIHSPKAKAYIQRFRFLKSHFLTLVMHQHIRDPDSMKDVQEGDSNTFIAEGVSTDYLEKLEQIANIYKFSDELKEQFVRVLQKYRKEEMLNLDFYRKISSEMMINVDTINGALEEIPSVLAKIAQRQRHLAGTRSAHSTASVELQIKLERWQQKRSAFSELFHFKHQKEVQNLYKLNQNCAPIFVKMDKIQRKMQAIEPLEFIRLKNNLKNNQNTALVLPLHNLLAFLHEKVQILPKDKLHQFVPAVFASSATLSAVLKAIRQREIYDKQATEQEIHMNRPIATGLTGNRLKQFLGRAQQAGESWKKLQKVSVIYKPLSTWLSHFHAAATHLKDYLQQQQQIDAHLVSQLSKLKNKFGDIVDVNYQKLNLPVFITQSQNRLQQITDTLSAFALFDKSSEVQQRKLSRIKRFYNERQERLEKIGRLMMESEYMKKASAGVSLYFKNIDQLSFHRALLRTTLNSCLPLRTIDPDILFGVFTARADLFNFREKMEAQNMGFEQLQIVFNLVEKHDKCLKLVQDRDSLIKSKLLEAAQIRGFSVQVFQQVNYPGILKFLQTKLSPSSRLLVLHQNIHYLEVSRTDSIPLFQQFVQESYALAQQRKAELIYVTNYLPLISHQMHTQLDFGKVVVTRQRFMSDFSDIFNVALQKDTPKMQQKKRRGDIETVVRQRNSLTKEIMSIIESLARVLQSQADVFSQRSQEQAENEQVFSQTLENQLSNLMGLEEEADILQRQTTIYGYLPSSIRNLIQEQLNRYLSIYSLTDRTNTSTNNQFFPGREFYREWMALLKDLREECISWFTRPEYRTVISEIVVKQDGEERPRQQTKRNEQEQTVVANQVNQAINPVFHRNNQEVFLALVQRLLRGTTWIQKSSLYQYALGVAVIQGLESNNHRQYLPNLLQLNVSSRDQINQECLRVLKMFDQHEFFRGYEIRFDKMTVQFFEALAEKTDRLTPGSQVAVITYYYLLSILNPSDSKVEDFLLRFCDLTGGKRVGLAHRYQFMRVLRSIRQNTEAVLRLTPPLNLSINLGDREKLVTIIQEQKYLLADLVQVLRVKSLSKKRELESVLVDMRRRGELVQTMKQHYRANRQWLLLANFSVKQRAEVRQLLEELLSQLARLPPNPFFRIFIVLNREEEGPDSLYYNKFQVSRVKGCHSLSDSDYCLAVNTLVLQQLFEGGRNIELIEQLIVSTIKDQDDYTIAEAHLRDLKAIFGNVVRRNRLLKDEDLKLFYRNLVQQVARLGYLKKEHNQANFYQYLANYFSLAGHTAADFRKMIEDQRQLTKMGLAETQLFQNTRLQTSTEQSFSIERINTAKIQEYFKNINCEYAEALRKQIIINNQIQSDQQFLQSLKKGKGISKSALQQAHRVCQVKYGLTVNEGDSWVAAAALRRLPLLRMLHNLKLREICLSKKVDIQTPAEFWIFLTAFQQREIKQFTRQLTLDRSEQQSRYSNGISLFGNFVNTRDYTTRMKMVLIDEQTYNQMPISEQELTNTLHNSERVEGRLILAIRKTGPQKIAQLNIEQVQVEKILRRFNVVLQIGGELTLEISFK